MNDQESNGNTLTVTVGDPTRAPKHRAKLSTVRLSVGLVALVLALGLSVALPASADAASVSNPGKFWCGTNSTVNGYFPLVYDSSLSTSATETIYWRPVLYMWSSTSTWVVYRNNQPWYSAAIGKGGPVDQGGAYWFDWPAQQGYVSYSWTGLPHGYYRVGGFFYQGNSMWLPTTSGGTWCQL